MRRLIARVTGGLVIATLSAASARLYATRARGFGASALVRTPSADEYAASGDAPIGGVSGLPAELSRPLTLGSTDAGSSEGPPRPRRFPSPRQRLWSDSGVVL